MTLPDKSEDYIHRIGRVGRADTMGLAISLVSAKPEKVWYCSKKGYKPWFNPSKEDTKQHAIWYDEKALLKDIEARIKHPVAPLGKDLALPAARGPCPITFVRSFAHSRSRLERRRFTRGSGGCARGVVGFLYGFMDQ